MVLPLTENRRRLIAWITRTCAGAVALALAVGVFALLRHTKPQVQTTDEDRSRPQVTVFAAQRELVRRQWNGFGTAAAMVSADIPARVIATVQQLPARTAAGHAATKGQLLVQLDDSDFQRQVEIAQEAIKESEAALENLDVERRRLNEQLDLEAENARIADAELGRVQKLFDDGAASQQGLDVSRRLALTARRQHVQLSEQVDRLGPRKAQLQAQLAGLAAKLRLAEQTVERCAIKSPIDGFLQDVDIEVGEELRPAMRVARVVDLRKMEVPLRLPAAARRDLAVGDQTLLTAANDAKQCWLAQVARITPEDDASTRTVTVYVEVDQVEQAADFGSGSGADLLAPGAFVSGVVTSERPALRWIVPRRAVRSGRILLARNGRVASRSVQVDFFIEGNFPRFGLPDDQWAVLAEDPESLSDGDLVLANGAAAVLDGDLIEFVLPADSKLTQPESLSPADAIGASSAGDGGGSATP